MLEEFKHDLVKSKKIPIISRDKLVKLGAYSLYYRPYSGQDRYAALKNSLKYSSVLVTYTKSDR